MLTIVIPSYNHKNYILSCLSAALLVDVPGRKIIVIDDGSTDGTDQVVDGFIKDNPEAAITFIRKPNSGLVSSLNLGLGLADTEFLYLVASDDIPCGTGIMQCIDALRQRPNCGFCIGGGQVFFDNEEIGRKDIYGELQEQFFKLDEEKRKTALFLNYPSPILLQSCVFRVNSLVSVGGWDSHIVLDDYAMFIKLLTRYSCLDRDFIYRPEFNVVGYRQHESNNFRNVKRQFSMVQQVISSLSPPELKLRAESKALAGYILSALRVYNFKGVFEILAMSSAGAKLLCMPFMIKLVFKKFVSRVF